MSPLTFLKALILLTLIGVGSFAGDDLTRKPRAKGQGVVEAVVDLIHHSCIFKDDNEFLRRLAFVESQDGLSGNTYRSSYYGGIWQVDESKLLQTKSSSFTRKYFHDIRNSFSIDWHTVAWDDLLKPLYSGLAARLYMEVMLHGLEIPRDINQQAQRWHTYYHDSNPSPRANFTATAQLLQKSCNKNKKLDAVFLLDSSGSVDLMDFKTALEFVVDWIEAFAIGPDATRVGFISFSTIPVIEMLLTNYTTKAELIQNVRAIQYLGGGTNTAEAIDVAVDVVLSTKYGARSLVPRAIILITDGQSNLPEATQVSAARAKQEKITMFSVGVGSSIGEDELTGIATEPYCSHVFHVDRFSEIQYLIQQMQEASCKTVINIDTAHKPDINGTKPIVTCNLEEGCNNIRVDTNSTANISQKAVVTTVNCGSATVYAAYNNPNPGAAYYELKSVATNNTPAIIFLDDSGRTIFISIEGHPYEIGYNQTFNCQAVTTIKDKAEIPTTTDEVKVVCIEKGEERKCLPTDLQNYKAELCDDFVIETQNPCSREGLLAGQFNYAYPPDNHKYRMCDYAGNFYVVQCPIGHVYHPDMRSCGLGAGLPGNLNGAKEKLNSKETNPCTINALLENHMLFAYVKDNTKFIYCDVWGNAWLLMCHDGFIWDSQHMECVVKSASGHVQEPGPLDKSIPNPCTEAAIAAKHLFFPYPLASDRYIQCDIWGDAFVMLCFLGGHWSSEAVACTAGTLG